ncbi:hypothetical protein J6590_028541 [Homalodisca vitripennis]|nr:hypothetical protein J6590_028541 [Homalodisca vitripennis]
MSSERGPVLVLHDPSTLDGLQGGGKKATDEQIWFSNHMYLEIQEQSIRWFMSQYSKEEFAIRRLHSKLFSPSTADTPTHHRPLTIDRLLIDRDMKVEESIGRDTKPQNNTRAVDEQVFLTLVQLLQCSANV